MTDDQTALGKASGLLLDIDRLLASAKPNDRSATDRMYAIALTKSEELLAWLVYMSVSLPLESPLDNSDEDKKPETHE